nr:hypothetical protein CJLB15_00094 [Campylobacter phage CJLB-15]
MGLLIPKQAYVLKQLTNPNKLWITSLINYRYKFL